MTNKKLPLVGSRVTVFDIMSVTWPERDRGIGVTGVVTRVGGGTFHLLPDIPDPTQNTNGTSAREHSLQFGWMVAGSVLWQAEQYVIDEDD